MEKVRWCKTSLEKYTFADFVSKNILTSFLVKVGLTLVVKERLFTDICQKLISCEDAKILLFLACIAISVIFVITRGATFGHFVALIIPSTCYVPKFALFEPSTGAIVKNCLKGENKQPFVIDSSWEKAKTMRLVSSSLLSKNDLPVASGSLTLIRRTIMGFSWEQQRGINGVQFLSTPANVSNTGNTVPLCVCVGECVSF